MRKKSKWMLLFSVIFFLCAGGAIFFLRQGKTEQLLRTKPEIIGIKDCRVRKGEELPEFSQGLSVTKTVKGKITVDVKAVDIQSPGEYEIHYKYKDIWGKKHIQTAKCIVYEDIEKERTEETIMTGDDIPSESTGGLEMVEQDDTPPKTSDELRIVLYIIILILSGTITAGSIIQKIKIQKI